MPERPKKRLGEHSLWPLYQLIQKEQWKTSERRWANNDSDRNENEFQSFLELTREKIARIMAPDLVVPLKHYDRPKVVIADPEVRKKYETKWKKIIFENQGMSLNETKILKEIDDLFLVWKKAEKIIIVFSEN